MSSQMLGEIHTNRATFPDFRSELSCVSGTTFSACWRSVKMSGYNMNGLCFRTYSAVPVSLPPPDAVPVQVGSGPAEDVQSPKSPVYPTDGMDCMYPFQLIPAAFSSSNRLRWSKYPASAWATSSELEPQLLPLVAAT